MEDRLRRRKREEDYLGAEVLLAIVLGAQQVIRHSRKKRRAPNNHYDRQHALDFVATWSDPLFKRQFRIPRDKHDELIASVTERVRPRNEKMAILSSGSTVGVQTKLLVTLRMLAGASPLDMVWYGVTHTVVDQYVDEILSALATCSVLKDIVRVPQTEEEVRELRAGWERRQMHSNHVDLLPGLALAVDGIVIFVAAPTQKEVEKFGVLNVDEFYNRKGGHALVCQGACDAFGEFRYFSFRHTGNTNDHIAYESTTLYSLFREGDGRRGGRDNAVSEELMRLYSDLFLVMDEAYSCLGGRHITPYSQYQLRTIRTDFGEDSYFAALVFNNRLSSARITIEIAFGMFMRRWGIFWKPLAYRLHKCMLIIDVCTRLHNLCIRDWKERLGLNGPQAGLLETPPCARLDRSLWLQLAEVGEPELPRDAVAFNEEPVHYRAVQNTIRDKLRDKMRALGFKYSAQAKAALLPSGQAPRDLATL